MRILFKKHCLQLIFAGLLVIFIAGVYLLNHNMNILLNLAAKRLPDVENNAQYVRFERARAVDITYERDVQPDAVWHSGLTLADQGYTAELLTGPHKGDKVQIYYESTLFDNVHLKKGEELIVKVRENPEMPGRYTTETSSYNRAPVLTGFVGLFFLLMIAIGKRKGLKSLVGLAFTLICVCCIFLPLFFRGADPASAAVLIAVLTAFVTLTLTGGWNRKSAAAIAGTVAGVIAASVIAYLTAAIAKISVFNTTDVEPLTTIFIDGAPLNLNNLLFAGIIIAALGAVMDVAMSVASSVGEVQSMGQALTQRQLFKSGMNVGKDMIGTMADTLILTFAGSSLNVLILLYSYNLSFHQLLNLDMLAIEVLQAIAGSIGIILTIPITAHISALLLSRGKTDPIQNLN